MNHSELNLLGVKDIQLSNLKSKSKMLMSNTIYDDSEEPANLSDEGESNENGVAN